MDVFQQPHRQLVHAQLTHTQLVHTQLAHAQLTYTQLVHTQLAHTAAVCVAGVALGDIDLHLAWQAWRLATWTCTLHGRRGAYGTGLALVARLVPSWRCCRRGCLRGMQAWRAWHAATSPLLCVAGVALGDMRGRHGTYGTGLALVARLVPSWCRCRRGCCGRRGTWRHRLALGMAGVALGDMDVHFKWQAWHLWRWLALVARLVPTIDALVPAAVCVAGVALGDIDLHLAWHLATWTCRIWLHTYKTKQNITLHYITLHYIKLHYITLHYITYIHTIFVTHHLSLSHNIFQIQLCPTQLFSLLDPSPPPLSFLPSPFRCNICCSLSEEVDTWGVIRSFNRF